MNPRRAAAITRRLLAQFRHDHRTLGLLFVTPLVVLGIFYFLFTEEARPAALGVVQLDEGALGPALVDQLSQSDLVEVTQLSLDDAESQLTEGDLDAYLVLPEDFTASALDRTLAPQLHLRGTDLGTGPKVQQALLAAGSAAIREMVSGPGFAPPEIEVQVTYRYGGAEVDTLDLLGGPFIGLLVFFLVYVVTSVSFLRERSQGTLERLMASPLRRAEIVVGYMAGFILIALVQAAEVLIFGIWLLDLYNAGDVLLIFGIEALLALAAVNLGIFLSTFARTEFQAVQFIPLVVVPQVLLSGVLVPVSAEPDWLQVVSNALPLTYAVDAMQAVMLEGQNLASADVLRDVLVLAGFCLLVIVAASATLRRTVA